MLFDYEEITVVSSSAFFTVLALGLLLRYRQISQKVAESSDLGKDLFDSLESRLRNQDGRILDLMARMEVIQARVLALKTPASSGPDAVAPPASMERRDRAGVTSRDETSHEDGVQHKVQQESQELQGELRHEPVNGHSTGADKALDQTQSKVIRLLDSKPMDTREITNALGKSREHTARVMKERFEMGLVARRTSEKPFTYELTDQGRRFVSSGL